MKKLLYLLAIVPLFFSCNEITDEPESSNILSGEILKPTTLTADKTYTVEGWVNVESDLIIEPGTVLKFKEDAGIYVGYSSYGSLKANGTADKPILFTSAAGVKSAGDYIGIYFYANASKSSILSYCNFEYAGGKEYSEAAIYVEYTSVSINNCTITKNAGIGVENYNGLFGSFANNNISDCPGYLIKCPALCAGSIEPNNILVGNGVLITNSDIESKAITFSKLSVPYIVDGISVQNSGSLTIEPGAILKFLANANIYIGFGSYGKLVADGTLANPIVFTSAAGSPSSGDWGSINFYQETETGSLLNYCKIQYAGGDTGNGGAVYSEYNQSKLTVSNCEISNSETCGIKAYECTPNISNVVYLNNANDLCND